MRKYVFIECSRTVAAVLRALLFYYKEEKKETTDWLDNGHLSK